VCSSDLTGKTASIKYVSKEEALKIYKEQNKNDPLLLDLVTADILPSSLEVQTTKPEYLTELAGQVKGSPLVEETVFQQDVVNTLTSWTSAFRKMGIGIIAALMTVSIFVIITIIGIKITIRKEEIEIMRLIGATGWFIRAPFILEGMFYGFMGALLGFVVSFGIMVYIMPIIETFLKDVPIFPFPYIIFLEIFAIEVILACFLGAFASFAAVLRYLK